MKMRNRWLWIALLGLLVYGWNYWGTSIYILDEAKNAGCAVEMMQRGDWITPMFNNEFHDKPALQYYFMMTAYSLFGVNPFSARFFSVIFGVLTLLSVYGFTRRIVNEQVAFYSSLILLSSLQMAYQFRMAVPDPYLLYFTTTGLFAFYVGYSERSKRYLYIFYACIGLAFLAKGPIAFALPGLIVLIFLIWSRDFSWRRLMELQLFPGALLTAAVGFPWYIAVGMATRWTWPEYFFITHNLDRYVTTFEGHHGFPLDTLVIVIGALMPLSFFFPQMLFVVWKEKKELPFLLFSLIVCITLIGFFLFSKTVLPSYPAPCIPFAAVLLAYFIARIISSKEINRFKLSINGSVFLIIALALPIAAFIALSIDPELKELTYLAYYFIPIPIGGIAALYFLFKDKMSEAFYSYIISFCVTLILVFQVALPKVDSRNPVSRSMPLIRSLNRPVAYFQWINSAYVFQYGQPIPKLSSSSEIDDFVARHGKVVIISSKKAWENANRPEFKVVFQCKDLFETPTSIVLSN
jgi:Dolichyl-phosphate-mannose-protein mannosyltransferase